MENPHYFCAHGSSAPIRLIECLHEKQEGPARHKCPACAFALGTQLAASKQNLASDPEFTCVLGSTVPESVLKSIQPSQANVGRHKCAACAFQLGASLKTNSQTTITELDLTDAANELDSSTLGFLEIRQLSLHLRTERNRTALSRIKQHLGDQCEGCGVTLSEIYGDVASGLIECHHKTPLSELAEGQARLMRVEDFAALCPNCHRVIHRLKDTGDIEALRRLVRSRR